MKVSIIILAEKGGTVCRIDDVIMNESKCLPSVCCQLLCSVMHVMIIIKLCAILYVPYCTVVYTLYAILYYSIHYVL